MKASIIVILLAAIGTMSCATTQPPVEKVIYTTTPLELPGRPTLPTWSASDVSCLSPELKQKMVDRERLRKEYINQLETIIKSTQ